MATKGPSNGVMMRDKKMLAKPLQISALGRALTCCPETTASIAVPSRHRASTKEPDRVRPHTASITHSTVRHGGTTTPATASVAPGAHAALPSCPGVPGTEEGR